MIDARPDELFVMDENNLSSSVVAKNKIFVRYVKGIAFVAMTDPPLDDGQVIYRAREMYQVGAYSYKRVYPT